MKTEKYIEQEKILPDIGNNIIGQFDEENIIVYQAYNNAIADYAIANQTFGGNAFSFKRMTWIKPNFLWMMYRSGWASKENQERILAITMKRSGFEEILKEATHSSFKPNVYETMEIWKQNLENTEVRLQWDPNHDPFGKKMTRKAIQLGMKGAVLEKYCTEWITSIEDITEFVKTQKLALDDLGEEVLDIPVERIYEISNVDLKKKLEIS